MNAKHTFYQLSYNPSPAHFYMQKLEFQMKLIVLEVSKMARKVQVLATNPNNLRSIPGTHIVVELTPASCPLGLQKCVGHLHSDREDSRGSCEGHAGCKHHLLTMAMEGTVIGIPGSRQGEGDVDLFVCFPACGRISSLLVGMGRNSDWSLVLQ